MMDLNFQNFADEGGRWFESTRPDHLSFPLSNTYSRLWLGFTHSLQEKLRVIAPREFGFPYGNESPAFAIRLIGLANQSRGQ